MPRLTVLLTIQIVAFCAIGIAVNVTPLFMATFPIFLEPVQATLNASRTAVMAGHSVCMVALAISGPVVGRLLDRYGQRAVLLAGIPFLALSLASFYLFPPSLPMFLAQCALVGLAGGATYSFVYLSVISLWFKRRLGIALGFAGAGVALGFMVFTPLTEYLTRTQGWQSALLWLGIISAVVGMANMLLYSRPPGESGGKAGAKKETLSGMSAAQVFRTVSFWQLLASYFLLCFMLNGIFLHFMAIMTARGLESTVVAAIMGGGGLAVLIGRIACGFLLTYFRGAHVGGAIFALGTVGAAIIFRADDVLVVTIGYMFLTLALGSEAELLNFMAFRSFGARAQGTTLGILTTSFLMGVLFGPLFMSIVFDRVGSYDAAYVVLMIAGALAAVLHWTVSAEKRAAGGFDPPAGHGAQAEPSPPSR